MMAPSNVRAMMLSRVVGGSCSAVTMRVSDVGFSITGFGGSLFPARGPSCCGGERMAFFVGRFEGSKIGVGTSSGGGLGCAC